MQIVIDISSDDYRKVQDGRASVSMMRKAIKNGTPLPKGHGALIDRQLALSDDGLCEFHRYDDYVKMRNYLKSIPTIIEADKAESE